MVDTLMEHQPYIHEQANTLDEMLSYGIRYLKCVAVTYVCHHNS